MLATLVIGCYGQLKEIAEPIISLFIFKTLEEKHLHNAFKFKEVFVNWSSLKKNNNKKPEKKNKKEKLWKQLKENENCLINYSNPHESSFERVVFNDLLFLLIPLFKYQWPSENISGPLRKMYKMSQVHENMH